MFCFVRSMGTWDLRMLTEKGKHKALSFIKAPKVGSGAYFSPNTGNKLIYTTYDNFVRYVCIGQLIFSVKYKQRDYHFL